VGAAGLHAERARGAPGRAGRPQRSGQVLADEHDGGPDRPDVGDRQQSQLALTLALARRPRLLILDEPLAALDPIARQDFLAAVMTAMTDDGVSVLLSSHQVAELERVADFLIVLSRARLQVAGEVDDLLAGHRLLTGPTAAADEYAGRLTVVQTRRGEAQTHLLVRTSEPAEAVPPGWESHQVGLEEVVMAYLRGPGVGEPAGPTRVQRPQPTEATR
jgi:ABC-2 type transport system ATP-binding protein